MKNCWDCKHHFKCTFGGNTRVCLNGNQTILDAWWNENQNKTRKMFELTVVDCYEPTQHAIMLDDMIALASEMKETLK